MSTMAHMTSDQWFKATWSYSYTAGAPYSIQEITSVSVDWSKTPFNLAYKIYVDRVTVDPAYIQDFT